MSKSNSKPNWILLQKDNWGSKNYEIQLNGMIIGWVDDDCDGRTIIDRQVTPMVGETKINLKSRKETNQYLLQQLEIYKAHKLTDELNKKRTTLLNLLITKV